MSEFHDPDLRQQLAHLSGPYPDGNAAFAAWQRRVSQVRRRRAVAWTTGAAMSLVVGTVGFAALQRPAQSSLVPGKSPDTSIEISTTLPTALARESSTIESTTPVTTTPTTLAPDTVPSTVTPTEPAVPEQPVSPAASSGSNGSSTKHQGGSPTTTVPDVQEPTTQTFTSDGGSITVRLNGDRLTVVDTNPAAGFHAKESNRSGRRVEVTFKSWNHESRITVRLGNGVMKDSVSESGDSKGPGPGGQTPVDTTPDDSSSGGHGSGGGFGDTAVSVFPAAAVVTAVEPIC